MFFIFQLFFPQTARIAPTQSNIVVVRNFFHCILRRNFLLLIRHTSLSFLEIHLNFFPLQTHKYWNICNKGWHLKWNVTSKHKKERYIRRFLYLWDRTTVISKSRWPLTFLNNGLEVLREYFMDVRNISVWWYGYKSYKISEDFTLTFVRYCQYSWDALRNSTYFVYNYYEKNAA